MTGQEDGLICKLHRSFFDLDIFGSILLRALSSADWFIFWSILLIGFSSAVKLVCSDDVRFQNCELHVYTLCKS